MAHFNTFLGRNHSPDKEGWSYVTANAAARSWRPRRSLNCTIVLWHYPNISYFNIMNIYFPKTSEFDCLFDINTASFRTYKLNCRCVMNNNLLTISDNLIHFSISKFPNIPRIYSFCMIDRIHHSGYPSGIQRIWHRVHNLYNAFYCRYDNRCHLDTPKWWNHHKLSRVIYSWYCFNSWHLLTLYYILNGIKVRNLIIRLRTWFGIVATWTATYLRWCANGGRNLKHFI